MPRTLSLSHPWNTPCTLSTHQLQSNAPVGSRANGECATTTTHGAGLKAAVIGGGEIKSLHFTGQGVKISPNNKINSVINPAT